jgi:hypothetical protein
MLLLALGLVLIDIGGAAQTPVNPDAATLADFTARIKAYKDLRAKVDDGTPPLKETAKPAEFEAAEKARASRIRSARASAKQGDIFTPAIEKKFRSLLKWETTGTDGAKVKKAITDEKPMVPLVVNGEYPKAEPLSTVPPGVLKTLPELPDGIEYRFVRRHLLLRDTQANLIIDFVLNAIQ